MAFRIFHFAFKQPACRSLVSRALLNRSSVFKLDYRRALYVKTIDKPKPNFEDKSIPDTNDEKSIIYAQNDPDIFGPRILDAQEEDPGDLEEEEYIQNPPSKSQRLRVIDYARLIKDHLNKNEVKEAIDILEIRMKKDRIKPSKYIFNLLISGCAKAGYSRKCFQLYNKMKQHGLPVSAGIYTSLFNACANAPWSEDGINKANRLREIMIEKGYTPNAMNYNAMIKAYGRCGDVQTAYILADEMMEKKIPVSTDTFNFLLQACASDAEFGFRHALLTWHKMYKKRTKPDIYSFNLMLRCVRDCSVGDIDTLEKVITEILENSNDKQKEVESGVVLLKEENTTSKDKDLELETSKSTNPFVENTSVNEKSIAIVESTPVLDETPNLLSTSPHLGSLVSIHEVKTPEDRFLLLGGFSGFLEEMKKFHITPGIATFTLMLEVIPSTRAAEKQLISMVRKIGLKADIDFFNVLIKKRSMRFDYDGAKEVLSMIKTAKLQPNIITYGVLALSCETQEHARQLLQEMHEKGIRINIQILGAMLRQGCAKKNFSYVYEIMQIALDEKIRPNEEFLKHLHNFQKSCFKLIENKHPVTKSKNFRSDFNNFKKRLQTWNEELGIENLKLEDAIKKLKESPYQQFKDGQSKGYEDIKNEKLRKKEKVRKYIRKIKVEHLQDDGEDRQKNKINTIEP